MGWVRPAAAPPPGTGQLDFEWVTAVRLEPAAPNHLTACLHPERIAQAVA